jgi:hypothetical protein
MSSSYIMLVTNIDVEFNHLAREHDALLERKWNFFSENQNLEAIISQFRIAN